MRRPNPSCLHSALLAAVAVLAACMPLDRRPPFAAPGYVHAVDEIGEAVRHTNIAHGAFSAGWSRSKIEVPAGAPLAGYGDREGAPHTGTADDVYVRAFAIGAGDERVVVFSADLLLVDPRVVEAVAERLAPKIARDHVFYTASHTHSGPGGYIPGLLWSLALGPYDAAVYDAIVDAHATAAEAALADLAPASIGSADVRVPGLIMNRVEKDGPVDDRMFVLRFEHLADHRTAALWIYSCHAVTRPASNLLVSADYPGDVARRVEGPQLELAAYAAGGVGSSNPKHERPRHEWIVNPLATALRRGLTRAAANARTEGRLASATAWVDTPGFRYRVDENVMVWREPIAALVDMPRMAYAALAIDDTVITFMPGEMSGELSRAMKRDARHHGVRLAVTSFNGSYVGYIVPRRVYDLDPERAEEMLHYETHVMAFFGPYGGDLMVNLGLRMARGVYGR